MAQAAEALRAAVPADARDARLAAELGTPLYVYDVGRLCARIRELREALELAGADLYFATMANDRHRVLREIAAAGVGACVNSVLHLELASSVGFQATNIQFTSTGITGSDMDVLHARGIRTNLDSLGQVRRWFGRGATEAGLRVNTASLTGASEQDRIGMDVEQLDEAVNLAAAARGRVTGLHVYVGTNFTDHRDMLGPLTRFFAVAREMKRLEYVNIGGGVGVNYMHEGPDFDLRGFGNALAALVRPLRQQSPSIQVIFEPGRGLSADCARLITMITDVKWLRGRRIATVDASVAQFPRPLLHPSSPHRIRVLKAADANGGELTTVVGRTTFSRDILGTTRLPSALEEGDLLAVDDAGAYCQSMASRFLGQPEPAETYIA